MTDLTPPDATLAAYRDQVREAMKAFDAEDFAAWEADRHIPRSALTLLAGRGLFRARWADGAYLGIGRMTTLIEELFRYDSGLAIAAMGQSEIFIGALARHGSSGAHAALLEDALAGRAVGCFAATEPQGGAQLAGIRTRATAEDDGWHLRGTKRYISNIGRATHAVLLARTDKAENAADLSLFIVPLNTAGVTVDGFFDAAGVQSCDVGQLSVDAHLPADALLGSPGLGLLYASHLLQFERLAICALLLAGGESALELAAGHARGRHTDGGRVIDKQVIRHHLATARADLWNLQSRFAEILAFARREQALPPHQISALKLSAGKRVLEIIDLSMQIFGARGNTTAYPLEKLWRDCRIARVGGGTDEVLSDMVASFVDRPDRRVEQYLAEARDLDVPLPSVARGHRATALVR
ncbi:acyl-CoA dehydrogenase family protein [Actinospica sp. MGRD01-02]|uniref:Acyl-[acyl-carrier-protein] dehydrogenase MbtN n=1 Tax=Actinospica acidithermotolerans TaxID=2828514 RepID=A0A941EAI5_9ACTN|nr:acyl-CoA dehydrogenase family protein [Actinospica acidithermotolerans]MBR7826923.1 acyl-CoA dehydrogenase family protein [Actinospica acidithermotolerans]